MNECGHDTSIRDLDATNTFPVLGFAVLIDSSRGPPWRKIRLDITKSKSLIRTTLVNSTTTKSGIMPILSG